MQPKRRPNGRNRLARKTPGLPAGRAFEADAPPPSGLLVSMVSVTFTMPFAARATLGVEKLQLTPAGSEAQPSPMVSAKPSVEVTETFTDMFCVVATVTLSGVTVRLKPAAVVEMETAAEEDAPWSVSPG